MAQVAVELTGEDAQLIRAAALESFLTRVTEDGTLAALREGRGAKAAAEVRGEERGSVALEFDQALVELRALAWQTNQPVRGRLAEKLWEAEATLLGEEFALRRMRKRIDAARQEGLLPESGSVADAVAAELHEQTKLLREQNQLLRREDPYHLRPNQ